jgi:transposase
MAQFPDEAHLSSWAGICPGNNECGGIKKSGKIRKGNNFLKGALAEVGWAAPRTKDSAYSAIYNSIAKRRGKKRALVALAHHILRDIYWVLKTGEGYIDPGANEINQRNAQAREQTMIRSLERLGYAVTKITA